MEEKLLTKAINIGNFFVDNAIKTDHGVVWSAEVDDTTTDQIKFVLPEIYRGISGIVLFLLELYTVTKDLRFLNTAIEGTEWAYWYCKVEDWNEYSFYSGRTGVSYVLIQLFKLTKDKLYLRRALEVSKNSLRFLEKNPECDLMHGVSGVILGLLHLHSETGEDSILNELSKHLDYIIEKAEFGPQGLYWDRSGENIHGLCGFSHGASGVGFVLSEFGHYFDNKTFYWLAEQAFSYEDFYFNKENKNWPDFRKIFGNSEIFDQAVDAYTSGNLDPFTKPFNMYAWCHGAPGINLARLRYTDLTNNLIFFRNCSNAHKILEQVFAKTMEIGLCHGLFGLVEYERIFNLKKRIYNKNKLDIDNVLQKIENNESAVKSVDLFNGIAGVGYTLLKNFSTDDKSILYPVVEKTNTKTFDFVNIPSISIIKMHLLKNLCPMTVGSLTPIEKSILQKKLSKSKNILKITTILALLNTSLKKDSIASLFFKIEKLKRLYNHNSSDALLALKNYICIQRNEQLMCLPDDQLNKLSLTISNEVKLFKLKNIRGKYMYFVTRKTEIGFKVSEVTKEIFTVLYEIKRTPAKSKEYNANYIQMIKQGLKIGIITT